MLSVAEALTIVNREAGFHQREADRPDRSDKQRAKHATYAVEWRSVAEFVQTLALTLDAANSKLAERTSQAEVLAQGHDSDEEDGPQQLSLGLTPDDLEGLPPELIAELNITEADKFEGFVVRKIRDAGGVMTLDKLLIACWRERNEIHKRNLLNAKLYRMTRKGLIWTVPNKKAVYTSDPEIGTGAKALP